MWPSPKRLRHSRVDEDVIVGNCRNYPLLFANDLVLLAASQQGLQNALDRKSALTNHCIMSHYTPKAVHSASERQYTAEGEIQVPQQATLRWYWRVADVGTKRLIHEFRKQTQFRVSFVFKDRKAFSFLIGLYFDPHQWRF